MPYTENKDWARVYGDMGTGVWVGDKPGLTLPTALKSDPGAGFNPAGWLGEDGIDLEITKDANEFHALQGGSLIKKKVGKVAQKFSFIALENSQLVTRLAYANQEIVVSGEGTADAMARIDIAKDQARSVELPLVVDVVEGDIWERYCVGAADIALEGKLTLAKNDELRAYSFTATILAGAEAYLLTNSPGMLVAPGAAPAPVTP